MSIMLLQMTIGHIASVAIGAFIGSAIGCWLAHKTSDWWDKRK